MAKALGHHSLYSMQIWVKMWGHYICLAPSLEEIGESLSSSQIVRTTKEGKKIRISDSYYFFSIQNADGRKISYM
jgi:hypothetical protein